MDVQEINNKGFFKKLSDGDFGLAKTYWLYGVLAGIIGRFLLEGISLSGSMALMVVFLLALVAYSVLQLTGAWNASNRYTGWRVWSVLAKIAVILGALLMLMNMVGLASLLA